VSDRSSLADCRELKSDEQSGHDEGVKHEADSQHQLGFSGMHVLHAAGSNSSPW